MDPWHEMIGVVFIGNVMCKDYWFSKYNRVLLHYSVDFQQGLPDLDKLDPREKNI
jgi:hypothetical protein